MGPGDTVVLRRAVRHSGRMTWPAGTTVKLAAMVGQDVWLVTLNKHDGLVHSGWVLPPGEKLEAPQIIPTHLERTFITCVRDGDDLGAIGALREMFALSKRAAPGKIAKLSGQGEYHSWAAGVCEICLVRKNRRNVYTRCISMPSEAQL